MGLLRETLRSDSDMSVRTQALESIVPFTLSLRDMIAANGQESDTKKIVQPVKKNKADDEVDTLAQMAQVKARFASNISAVLSAMQDSVGSADGVFIKRASASLRYMMGSADKGADMVQEPHREQEGYIAHAPRPHSGLRHALAPPDVLAHVLGMEKGSLLSPMGEYFEQDDWEDEDKESSAWVLLDGKVVLRNQVSPRSLQRALPSPCPIKTDSPMGSPMRSVRRKSKPHAALPDKRESSPFQRKKRNSLSSSQRLAAEEAAAGRSEYDVMDRSGVPVPPDIHKVVYGSGMVQDSNGFFAELPADVRQGLGPMRLGVVGRAAPVDVLLFWRRGHIWTLDISDCIVRPTASTGSASSIWKLEERSFLSCSNVRTQHIFPHLNDSSFRFAAGTTM